MCHKRLWLSVLLACACTGCRTPINQELLELENRALEDRVYELEAALEDNCDLVDELEYEKEGLHERLSSGRPGSNRGNSLRSLLLPDEPAADDAAAPAVDELPAPLDEGAGRRGASGPAGLAGRGSAGSAAVNRIVIDRLLQPSVDGKPGGVVVVIEPRDAADQLVAVTAPLEVSVARRDRQGRGALLAHWTIPADEAAQALRTTPQGRLIYLELPWPREAPSGDDLRLTVQYRTTDGRQLVGDVPLDALPLGAQRRDWTAVAGPSAPAEDAPRSARTPRRPAWSPERR